MLNSAAKTSKLAGVAKNKSSHADEDTLRGLFFSNLDQPKPLPPQVDLSSHSTEEHPNILRSWNRAGTHQQKLNFAIRYNFIPYLHEVMRSHPELCQQSNALTQACLYGNLTALQILIDVYHLPINKISSGGVGEYPLFQALSLCNENTLETVKYLLQAGANVNVKSPLLNLSAMEYCLNKLHGHFSSQFVSFYLPIAECIFYAGGKNAVAELTAFIKNHSSIEVIEKFNALPNRPYP